MMGNGEMIFLMVGELYFPKLQIGTNMKENLGMELRKVEVECILETDLSMMENLGLIKFQGEAVK